MTRDLRYLYLSPDSGGAPERLMVFLHGYGSHGGDFIDVAKHLRRQFPRLGFLLPDAPEAIPLPPEWAAQMETPEAFQWFALGDWLNEANTVEAKRAIVKQGVREALPVIERFLQQSSAQHGCPLSEMILFGFSQGAMSALDAALRLDIRAGIACAGMLAFADEFADHYHNHTPILLCHGAADDVVPAEGSQEAHQILRDNGADVTLVISPQTAHHLDPMMLKSFADFLERTS